MAGLSSRFFKAGYSKPKYMLEARGETLFEHSVKSFEKYFSSEIFVFIVKNVFDTPEFVKEKVSKLGIENYHIIALENDTRGQAETVAVGLSELLKNNKSMDCDNTDILIFNIDTFRFGYVYPDIRNDCDGFLEVFKGEGDNWSFAKAKSQNSTQVIQTAEKNPISNLCSTGLYYFKSIGQYLKAFNEYAQIPKDKWEKHELYVAPLYNLLIRDGFNIHYDLIKKSDVIFCGIPSEYDDFLNKNVKP